MKKERVITTDDIIRGAMRSRRPKVRFPGLSAVLQRQANELLGKKTSPLLRREASPFVKEILSRSKGRRP
jgi:hypothetical protein